jgi:hypothetical protein
MNLWNPKHRVAVGEMLAKARAADPTVLLIVAVMNHKITTFIIINNLVFVVVGGVFRDLEMRALLMVIAYVVLFQRLHTRL